MSSCGCPRRLGGLLTTGGRFGDLDDQNGQIVTAPARKPRFHDCRTHVLDRRALENYFTDTAVKAVLGPGVSALAPYDKPVKSWKADNWRIAQGMAKADIETTDLGQFIEAL